MTAAAVYCRAKALCCALLALFFAALHPDSLVAAGLLVLALGYACGALAVGRAS